MNQTQKMNFNHLENCKCLQCHPPCRLRYSKKEWHELTNQLKNKVCRHCLMIGISHAGSHWDGDGMTAAGSCHIDLLKEHGIRPKAFIAATLGATAMNWSVDYVFEPLES